MQIYFRYTAMPPEAIPIMRSKLCRSCQKEDLRFKACYIRLLSAGASSTHTFINSNVYELQRENVMVKRQKSHLNRYLRSRCSAPDSSKVNAHCLTPASLVLKVTGQARSLHRITETILPFHQSVLDLTLKSERS